MITLEMELFDLTEVKVDIDLKMMIAETTVTKPKSTARLISVEDESSSDSSRRVNRFSETSDGSEVSNEVLEMLEIPNDHD